MTHFHLKTEFLLPNNVNSVPNAPFLILLSHFEDMGFQISNVLRKISTRAAVFMWPLPLRGESTQTWEVLCVER